MGQTIIGRTTEQHTLQSIWQSGRPEFVAVYGRRRVGKTFLVREFFGTDLVFQTAGLANTPIKKQIRSFYMDVLHAGLKDIAHNAPKDWLEVFCCLQLLLERQAKPRYAVLLDELPWMDTPRSGFVQALEHFWNVWGSAQSGLVMVVCGSATSWMMDKLINNHGGLHNRLTQRIMLKPFTLAETEQMLNAKGFHASRYDTALLYMTMGGVPFYLDMLHPTMSIAQNLDALFFSNGGALRSEMNNLYPSLFKNASDYESVMKALCEHRYGMLRDEITKATGLSSGGTLTQILNNLEWCGFITSCQSYREKGKNMIYRVADFYTLFYHNFITHHKAEDWMSLQGRPEFSAWAGLTFEL